MFEKGEFDFPGLPFPQGVESSGYLNSSFFSEITGLPVAEGRR